MSRQLCALITGCSTGLGWLTAQALVERGHTAVATMRELHGRNAGKAASLEESVAGSAGALHVVELDVTSQDSVDAAVAEAERLTGPLDAAVNNAGYGGAGYVEAFTAAQLSDMFEVNVMGVHRVNRAVLPGMRERGAGVVITAGSTMGRTVLPYAAAYTSTKFALEGLLESLHYELKGTGVDVSILQLGAFETAFHGNMVGPADEVRVASYGETISTAEAASPTLVSDAIVELIESPRGSTPLRLVIDPITGGAGVPELNEVGARIQLEVLGAVGADYLLA